jgi:LEA14-like dessication related protein
MRPLRTLLLIGLALTLGGCASMLPKLEAPRLSVTGIRLDSSGNMQQQQVLLTLHAVNPNSRDIPIRSIACKLEIESMPFAEGKTEESFVLPANGAVDFKVDVVANVNGALIALAGGLGSRSMNYRLYGEVHLKGSIVHSIPFDQKGRVKF